VNKLLVPAKEKQPATRSPLEIYLQEIAKYPLLEPEEEFELAKRHFDDSEIDAAHRLITSNLRLVVKIAYDFNKASANLLDLIQEGNYGLMQAVKKFNPYKGVKLSSYAAWWIRAYILKFLMDNRSQVRIATTAAQRKLFYNLQKEVTKLLAEYDTADTKLIAHNLNVPERDVIEMQKRLYARDISLDAPLGNENDPISVTHKDFMADDKEVAIDDLLADQQVKMIFSQHLAEFKSQLKGRDLEIFETRLVSEKPLTLQEIGNKYGISRERARQIEARIVQKLKEFIKEKGTLDL
jgi:RNA polymerase sigma-32 factor